MITLRSLPFSFAMISRSLTDSITLYGETAVVREVDFVSLVDTYAQVFVQQLERVRELNAGPIGEDIVNTPFNYLNNAAIRAALITMQALVSTGSINVPYPVNPSTQWIEAWLRQNCAKATLPMSEVEATVFWLAGGYRPVCLTASGARAHVISVVAGDLLNINNNQTCQAYFNAVLSRPDVILGGIPPPGPRNPSLCVAAYSRFVAFKKQMFGIPTFAVPTSGESLPYMMAQYDLVGNTVYVYGNFALDSLSVKELAVGYLLSQFNVAIGFPVPNPARAIVGQQLGLVATNLCSACWLKAIMIRPLWEADGCDFIGRITGPSWPALAGRAAGAGGDDDRGVDGNDPMDIGQPRDATGHLPGEVGAAGGSDDFRAARLPPGGRVGPYSGADSGRVKPFVGMGPSQDRTNPGMVDKTQAAGEDAKAKQ